MPAVLSRRREEPVERRLAAILAADVVAYSRLIREDETAVPSENPIRRRNSRVWPNRGKVGACVMPYDFCP